MNSGESWGCRAHFQKQPAAQLGNTMAKYQLTYAYIEGTEVVHADHHFVDGEWMVFMDGSDTVLRKRASLIEEVRRIAS